MASRTGGEGENVADQPDCWVQIRVRHADDSGNHQPRFVCVPAGRRHGAITGLREGHFTGGAERAWVSAGGAADRLACVRSYYGPSSADGEGGANAAVGGNGVRAGNNRFWFFDIVCVFA